jgi:hypothetical protein
VADVEGIGSRVDADVCYSHLTAVKKVFDPGRHVVDHPAPAEFFNKIHKK